MKKLAISLGMLLLAALTLFLFWHQSVLATGILLCIALAKHHFLPLKHEFFWFMLVAVGGTIIEITIVNIPGAWAYRMKELVNIPLYMPFFWGLTGTCLIPLYESILNLGKS